LALKSHEAVQTGPEQLWLFSKLVCMHSNHFAMKKLLFKIAELEIVYVHEDV